jgi:hypothetical protein
MRRRLSYTLVALGLVLCVAAVECQTLIPLDGSACSYLRTWGCDCILCTAVFVTWNGTNVTGPILIYHDEIEVDSGPTYDIGDINADGALVCTSATRPRVSWRNANHSFFNDVFSSSPGAISTTRLNQIRTPFDDLPNVARLSRASSAVSSSEPNQNGLWACRVNRLGSESNIGGDEQVAANIVFVGIYWVHVQCGIELDL